MYTDSAEDLSSSPTAVTASVPEGDFEFETIKVEPDIPWITAQTPAPADNVPDGNEFHATVEADVPHNTAVPAPTKVKKPAKKKKKKTVKMRWNCDECALQLDCPDKLEDHRRLHRAICPFKCSECASSFPERSQLARHRLDEHHEPKQRFTCRYCRAVVWSDAGLRMHMNKLHHQGQNAQRLAPPFRCLYCGRRFDSDFLLARHQTTHGQLPFACPVCGLAVGTSAELTRHAAQHTEVPKPFRCRDCDEDFSTFQGFTIHARKHSGPQSCQDCGALYLSAAELQRHMEEHCGLVHLDRLLQIMTLATDAQVLFSGSG